MDASNKFKVLIGLKIYFRTCDGREFEGTVKRVSFEMKNVTVQNVFDLRKNVLTGDLTFFFHEFLTYSKINRYSNSEIENILSSDAKVSFSKYNCLAQVFRKNASVKVQNERCVIENDLNQSDFVLKLPPNLPYVLPNDSVILDSIDHEFRSATNHISKQSVIGVSFHGYRISRVGKLFWICIASECCVFLYDILALGKSAFDHSLKDIFQSQSIKKVIYDSRGPSDCLYHIFSTTLVNVFDIQVADFTCQQKCGSKSGFEKEISLDRCLVNYLAVPKEFLYDTIKLNCNYFSKRPLDNDCRNILIKDTLYLNVLYEKLKLMLNPVCAESQELTPPSSFTQSALLERGLEIVTIRKDSLKPLTSSKLKRSLKAGENELSEKDICKIGPSEDIILNRKSDSKSKHVLGSCSLETPEMLVNDMPKCSVGSKDLRNKIHDYEKFKSSPVKMTFSQKQENHSQLNYHTTKTDANKVHQQKYERNKFLVNGSRTETKAYSNFIPQNESSDNNAKAFNNIRNYTISDYSDTWEKLRSNCGTSNNINMSAKKSNIKMIPSGMNC